MNYWLVYASLSFDELKSFKYIAYTATAETVGLSVFSTGINYTNDGNNDDDNDDNE